MSRSRPRLKFCGFTRVDDLKVALECGVDAVGFNFFPKSPRYVNISQAGRLAEIAGEHALRVGIFVDEPIDSVVKIVREVPLDVIQLHGDEGIDYLRSVRSVDTLREIPVWRAMAWRGEAFPEDEAGCRSWVQENGASTILIDAHDPVQRGGTGKQARWDLLSPRPEAFGASHFLLAGGIRVDNVAEAIQIARPDGIDVASGIESSPGKKDANKMRAIAAVLASNVERNSFR